MDQIRIREFAKLKFQNPCPILVRLREIEVEVAKSNTSPKIRHLRTNPLKSLREMREAALFCYGMGRRIGQTVFLARSEEQDHDFIASWAVDDVQHIVPVQLKEVVAPDLNEAASVQNTIDSLSKYVDSEELAVAIHLNQRCHFEPINIIVPTLRISQLWIFGAISEDQSEWGLWGDFLEEVECTRFAYPT